MKKIFSLLIILSSFACSFAQSKDVESFKGTHEMSISGAFAPLGIQDIVDYMFLPITGIYVSEKVTSPVLSLNYYYHTSNSISVGAELSFGTVNQKLRSIYDKDYELTQHNQHFAISPTVRLKWFRRKSFWMYSALGMSVMLANTHNYEGKRYTEWYGTLNLTLAGIQFGRKNWFGFSEIGLSSIGCVRAGIGYRFNHK